MWGDLGKCSSEKGSQRLMESLTRHSETLLWVLSMVCSQSGTSPRGKVPGKLLSLCSCLWKPQPASGGQPGVTPGQQSGQKARCGRGEQEQVIHFVTRDSLSLFLTAVTILDVFLRQSY